MSYNRVEIDLGALAANYRLLNARLLPGCGLLAMVKSEAYGHGLVRCALALQEEGCRAFGVAEVEEGARLRQAGIAGRIIVTLGPAPDDDPGEILRHHLEPVLVDVAQAVRLSAVAEDAGRVIPIHAKIDVGMGRFGELPVEAAAFVARAASLPGLNLVGLMSHFPGADSPDPDPTHREFDRYLRLVERILPELSHRPLLHIANSAALFRHRQCHCDMVRPGIALYGCSPFGQQANEAAVGLRPVMAVKTSVVQVKAVPAGWGISYGHRFVTDRPSRMAVLPIGYDDGLLRRLTGRAQVLIRGGRVPLVGTICMNACVADVTDLAEVRAGDEVVVLGSQGQETISADEIALWSETISYEILCLFGSRNRRVYLDG
ncbi:MAG: alanine racemase [Thermodesulfobacteriota bacterium]